MDNGPQNRLKRLLDGNMRTQHRKDTMHAQQPLAADMTNLDEICPQMPGNNA